MLSIKGAIVGIVLLIAAPTFVRAQTSRLDAPVSTKPTVRSEIMRGTSAALDCLLETTTHYLAFTRCLSAVEEANRQRSTLSDPFILGLSVEALINAELINPADNGGRVAIWRQDTARIIKAHKLSAKDICEAREDQKCDVVIRIVSQAK